MPFIEIAGLRQRLGNTAVLDGVDLQVGEGRILGLVGLNGAGKTTLLNALVGLTDSAGSVKVLGRDPWCDREALMRDVAFVADVALLPRWMRVDQALDYNAGVHPRFDRTKADGFLAATAIQPGTRIADLSKGMVAQLHLAMVMATDAKVLVLDEPTLGLDLLYRKQFFDSLLNDYFNHRRSIVVATHQVEEIEAILTDVAFIHRGRILLACSMDDFAARYTEVVVSLDQLAAGRTLGPLQVRKVFGRTIMLFDGIDRERVATLGSVRTPSIADVFVALVAG